MSRCRNPNCKCGNGKIPGYDDPCGNGCKAEAPGKCQCKGEILSQLKPVSKIEAQPRAPVSEEECPACFNRLIEILSPGRLFYCYSCHEVIFNGAFTSAFLPDLIKDMGREIAMLRGGWD